LCVLLVIDRPLIFIVIYYLLFIYVIIRYCLICIVGMVGHLVAS